MSRLASLFLTKSDPVADDGSPPEGSAPTPKQYHILFVDDEPNVIKSMMRIFRQENYGLLAANSGQEALSIMDQEQVQVVISDHRMPEMNGTDLLREIKRRYPATIRIMLTGYADVDAVMGAVNDGAVYKFITKPWNDEDLRLTVSLALEQYDLIQENKHLRKKSTAQKKELKRLSRFINVHHSHLGNHLLRKAHIKQNDLEKALRIQKSTHKVLPKILVDMDVVDETTMISVIEDACQIDRVFPNEFSVTEALAALIPKEVCEKNILVPLKKTGSKLIVAMADPTDYNKVDDLKFITGLTIHPVVASQQDIVQKLVDIYGEDDSLQEAVGEIDLDDPTENIEIIIEEDDEHTDLVDLLKATEQPPAIRIVNAVISDALRHGASDVHIEPKTKYTMVRYRIDDLLEDKLHIPPHMHMPMVSRIKIMSDLDIAERRRPQDGRITVKTSSRMVDMRISTLPTINGEKVVFRILDKNAAIRDVEDIGLLPQDLEKAMRIIDMPQGIVLTTGPTGSGKTSTLYSLLRKGAKITKNFTTIEDPVEYYMNMAEQVNVKDKIGLSFSSVLRSILRQDPNVIMLGEIRDFETAEVAFHASLTGHLVLSTLHTNSAIASITRLLDMGVKSYVIADALIGIIAQRLVRRICPHCIGADTPPSNVLHALRIYKGHIKTQKGAGCKKCHNTGYKGRLGIFEIFLVDGEMRRMMRSNASESELMRSAKQSGMTTLLDDAIRKIDAGMTTCEEVLRVFGPQNTIEIPCEQCNSILEERYPFCPYCGAQITKLCTKCGHFMADDWRFCPNCQTLSDLPSANGRIPGARPAADQVNVQP
jgi:type II secretory ATPase GspE/PulE/Tfp pilus assembly ATPase PilB-like protein/FixJ family two-component response regulator/RNA polymerase subunit RPABC4/transcription elongation factor Spt4